MRRLPTRLEGPILIEPSVHGDARGFFVETYRENVLAELGITERWVQDNQSRSTHGVLRGMHFQLLPGQAKLVRCSRGRIMDVVVDIRSGSPTFGQWESQDLNDASGRSIYVPVGFAHGFVVLSDEADVVYKCSDYYVSELERGIAFDDPDIGIEWPDMELTASQRDRHAPRLRDVAHELPFVYDGGS